nr:tetraacyldisaccharide 4'-kinase [Alteromonas ponticola]
MTTAWYQGAYWVWLLSPLTLLFWMLSSLRRWAYRRGIFASSKPDAFIIVVGNISVGGNGKTPVVIALTKWFQQQKLRVGVLSRGYGGSATTFPHSVSRTDAASVVGDEPKLIAQRTGAPVVIDPKRTRGATSLKNLHKCDVIICDDGLQHYALQRDIELVVMDDRGVGNGKLLPMGPLREGKWRLNTIDAIIHNVQTEGEQAALERVSVPQYAMKLQGYQCVRVTDQHTVSIDAFRQQHDGFTAIAGIGAPARFFNYLAQLKLSAAKTISFNDHHKFEKADLPQGVVLMTEKDAVKVEALGHEQCWYLPIEASLPEEFYQQIEKTLPQSILNLRSQNGI